MSNVNMNLNANVNVDVNANVKVKVNHVNVYNIIIFFSGVFLFWASCFLFSSLLLTCQGILVIFP
jgi:hypothetical protein